MNGTYVFLFTRSPMFEVPRFETANFPSKALDVRGMPAESWEACLGLFGGCLGDTPALP